MRWVLTAGRVSSPLTSRWDRRWSLTSHVPEHHTSWQKVSLFSCLGWLRLVTSQTVSWLLLSLAGRFGFPLQLCCLWDECPLPGTVMTPLLAGSASRRADSVAQPAPTHLSPPGGVQTHTWGVALGKCPGKGHDACWQSQRWLQGMYYEGLRGAGHKPRGALPRGLLC